MVLDKKEKKLMDVIYPIASQTAHGQCLVSPQELLEKISYKVDFRESDLETNLTRLELDNYLTYQKAKKTNGDKMYLIALQDNGISYIRDRQIARRKMIWKIFITIAIAALSFSIKNILKLILG